MSAKANFLAINAFIQKPYCGIMRMIFYVIGKEVKCYIGRKQIAERWNAPKKIKGRNSGETAERARVSAYECGDVASWIYVLLLLLTAVWLTLIPRSRKLASQAEELNAKMKDFRPEV